MYKRQVTITTDVTDKEYTGVVENISVNGTAGSNGVTTYPVKVNIIDFDDALLPGMNVEANIIISSVHNVLAIPVSNLNRGNTVYVKGDKTEENDKAPEGYKTVSEMCIRDSTKYRSYSHSYCRFEKYCQDRRRIRFYYR